MRRLLALAAMLVVGSIGNAQAATITFEDLAIDDGPIVGGDRTSGGFFFDTATEHLHIVQAAASWGTGNGTNFMLIDDVGGTHPPATNPITFSPTLGGPFALLSIDISEASQVISYSRQIEVTGNVFGGGTVFTVLDLDDNFVDSTPANYFQTFTFDPTWGNLTSVILQGINSQPLNGNYYAIDNIVVDTTAVPEPGTLSLLGLGSAYLIRRRRRNRR
jgi:PEP-CTERM motif